MNRLFFVLLGIGAGLYFGFSKKREMMPDFQEDDGRSIMLKLDARNAGRVSVAGTFNSWNPDADRMFDLGDGNFCITLFLRPGRYHYKFVLDDSIWIHDPGSVETDDDGFGGRMSVLEVE